MFRPLITPLILASLLNGQFNHQDKLVFKRPLGKSTYTIELDGRTNETGFFHKHMDFGLHYPIKNDWKVGLKYRQMYRTSDDGWQLEQRPQAEVIKTIKRTKIKWQIRSRMDYRIREGKDDAMRNRTRIQLKSNNQFTRFKLTPFFRNEFFFSTDPWKYYINRIEVGIDLPKTNIGEWSIYYKYNQTLTDGAWEPAYTFVFKLAI